MPCLRLAQAASGAAMNAISEAANPALSDVAQTAAENVQSIIEARQRAQAKAAEQMQAARIVPGLLIVTLVFFTRDPGFRYSFQVPLVQLALGLAAVMMYAGYSLMADMAREAV